MLSLKPGARVAGIRPEMALAAAIVHQAFRASGWDAVITSAVDGAHSRGSLHYAGQALDFRLNDIDQSFRPIIVARTRAALGEDFDVVWEAKGTPNEHLHVEFQPKRGI